jgi:hypothetical protein
LSVINIHGAAITGVAHVDELNSALATRAACTDVRP